jgi:hypothetical protein
MAARNVAPVNSGGEFVIAGLLGLLERGNADHVQEHAEITRFRTGCAGNPRYPLNRRFRYDIASFRGIVEHRPSMSFL